jgi:hypothetical protein
LPRRIFQEASGPSLLDLIIILVRSHSTCDHHGNLLFATYVEICLFIQILPKLRMEYLIIIHRLTNPLMFSRTTASRVKILRISPLLGRPEEPTRESGLKRVDKQVSLPCRSEQGTGRRQRSNFSLSVFQPQCHFQLGVRAYQEAQREVNARSHARVVLGGTMIIIQ